MELPRRTALAFTAQRNCAALAVTLMNSRQGTVQEFAPHAESTLFPYHSATRGQTASAVQGTVAQTMGRALIEAVKYAAAQTTSYYVCGNYQTSPVGSDNISDCVCNAGYAGPNGGACDACSAGSYKDIIGDSLCQSCPTNSDSPSASDAITDCLCNVEYTGVDGGEYFTCPAGKYKDVTGSTECDHALTTLPLPPPRRYKLRVCVMPDMALPMAPNNALVVALGNMKTCPHIFANHACRIAPSHLAVTILSTASAWLVTRAITGVHVRLVQSTRIRIPLAVPTVLNAQHFLLRLLRLLPAIPLCA